MAPYIIKSLPGIKRDGTRFENGFYVDGQWCRFQRGLPRKMGGYRTIAIDMPEISRGLNSYNEDARVHLMSGSKSYLYQYELNTAGVVVATFDRTPSGFVANDKHLWTFDTQYDAVGVSPGAYLLAHPGHNLSDIDWLMTCNSIGATPILAPLLLRTPRLQRQVA